MTILGIIPARYASSRFPGKPLARINGKSIIKSVYEQCNLSAKLDKTIVATDDERIYQHVIGFGGEAVITSSEHLNGTSRCFEALQNEEKEKGISYDIVINIQGDEPFIEPEQIDKIASVFINTSVQIGTLAKKINNYEELFNPNVVKLVTDSENKALYFSRHPIPFVRDIDEKDWLEYAEFYKHIGIYGYRKNILMEITKLEPGKLEIAERLEQLRWIENGYKITVDLTEHDSIGIDTPEDLLKLTNKA